MDSERKTQIALISVLTIGFLGLLYYRRKKIDRKVIRRRTTMRGKWMNASGNVLQEHKSIREDASRGVAAPMSMDPPGGMSFPNPLIGENKSFNLHSAQGFVPESLFNITGGYVLATNAFANPETCAQSMMFVKGTPRAEIVMDPATVKVAIVTCGGLCPGLNVVIREIVMSLTYNYGVKEIYGVYNGYMGLYSENCIRPLDANMVSEIHTRGGTILRTSRGGFDLEKICNGIEAHGFNQLYVLGGDGTHRGIMAIQKELTKRNYPCFMAGIPKTIDNDIPIIDKSFGFESAVEEAQRAINSANVEAKGVMYGVGLVKLMGRNSGFIALQASVVNRGVNICLIPESEYELNGPNGVYEYIYQRILVREHVVVVVAEGASTACVDEKLESTGTDASGNPVLFDIGKYLKEGIPKYCKNKGLDITLKYIDPTYMIRTIPANSHDKSLCALLATGAVHGVFGGFTGFSIGTVGGHPVLIPIDKLSTEKEGKNASAGQRKVNIDSDIVWWRFRASSGQPSFRNS